MSLLVATCALEPAVAHAASAPCAAELQSPVVAGLAERLASTDDRGTWAEIVDGAAPLTLDAALTPADRACAAYVAGSASFFLSDRRAERRRRAADAARFFALAQALASDEMSGRQPKSRMRTTWTRLGRVPGWLTGRPVPVEVSVPDGADRVRLSPADPAAWHAVCPEAACADAVVFVVPAGAGPIDLPPGRYIAEAVGRCGASRREVELGAGRLAVGPPPPCTARLTAVDGEQPVEGVTIRDAAGASIDPAAAPVGQGPLTVSAPGYADALVEPPAGGGPVEVELARCRVDLIVETRPPGAAVEGAGPGPWGPRPISATADGQGRLEETVDVPRPERCTGARYTTAVALPRPVTLLTRDDRGEWVSVGRLFVDDAQVDPLRFHARPGQHTFEAVSAEHGIARGAFEVAPCATAACPPVEVVARFGPPVEAKARRGGGPGTGSTVTMAVGGALVGAGLIAGAAAWANHRRIEQYDTKRTEGDSLDTIIDTRDTQALTADVLFVSGGVSLTVGLLWWLFEDDR